MFGNPCTMQIIAKHWTEALIRTPAKPVNAPLIEEFTGVPNYKGRTDQIETVMKHITAENYANMRQRVCNLETQDKVTGSSNFGRFMELFESCDAKWIDKINEVLEG